MKFFMVTFYFTVFFSMDKLSMVTRINQLEKDHQELYEALAALQSNNKNIVALVPKLIFMLKISV